ncbi:MAG: tyrosine-type recombinase/integrase [Desulfobacteraceae bacterium]|nr:tyrosine-type recombinase/integrase [Desulfobacteraceae bacterium]
MAILFLDTMHMFLESLSAQKGCSAHTLRACRHNLLEFAACAAGNARWANQQPNRPAHIVLNYFKANHIRHYLGFLHGMNAKAFIARKLLAVRSFFKYCQKNKLIDQNPAESIRSLKQEQSVTSYLPADESFSLIEAMQANDLPGLRNTAILETLYSTGARVSELSGLDIGHLDCESEMIRVAGKANKQRIIAIGKKALETIDAYRKAIATKKPQFFSNEDPLFLNKNGKRLTTRSMARIAEKFVRVCKLQVSVSPYAMRHSYATHLLDAGEDLRAVQELLGLSSLSATQRYAYINIYRLMEAYGKAHPGR